MLHATTAPPPAASPPTPSSRPATGAGEGLVVTITTRPLDTAGPACTPELAARLVVEGLGVALVDETARDRRQLLHLPAPASPSLDDELHADRLPTATAAVAR